MGQIKTKFNIPLNEGIILPIISDGIMASPNVSDGHFIPILILDTSKHKAINDLVNLHEYCENGDVDSTWAIDQDNDYIYLFLEFKKPVRTEAIIKFDILRYGGLVESLMSTRIFYLQPGKEGDRPSNSHLNPSIFIEVPDLSLKELWSERLKKTLIKDLRSKGLSRSEAKKATPKIIDEWRKQFCISLKEHAMKCHNK